ncbi:hypothetical protein [Terrarubrum flagellatum]|uniref:hypothetical protein n=1 Tax=Terrirubrum flagellatum TaxID=2895980 RepID=UPI0031454117
MPAILTRIFWFALALIFLIEAWLWRHLEAIVERIVAALPFETLKRKLSELIGRLPPYATLIVFIIPGIVLLPFKFAALWLLSHGQLILGGLVFVAAKLVGTAIAAYLFHVCHEKLMTLGWFARLYNAVIRAKHWADDLVKPYKRRIRAYGRLLRMRNPSLFARRVAWLRRRAAARAAA